MAEPDFAAVNQLLGLLQQRKDALTVRWLAVTGVSTLLAPIPSIVMGMAPKVPLPVTIAFWVASAVLAGLSLWLPHKQLNDLMIARRLKEPVDVRHLALKMKLKSEQMRVLDGLPELEQRLFALTLLFEKPYNLGLALSGGLALLGVAYGLLARTLVEASPALFGALALYCYHYPRLAPLIDRGRKIASKVEEEALVRGVTSAAQAAEQRIQAQTEHAEKPEKPDQPAQQRARQRMPTPPARPMARAALPRQAPGAQGIATASADKRPVPPRKP